MRLATIRTTMHRRQILAQLGAASLAQAHPAWLADGRKVAVKVLRPGVERRPRM